MKVCLYFILTLDPTRHGSAAVNGCNLGKNISQPQPAVTKSNELTELEIQAKGAECVFLSSPPA